MSYLGSAELKNSELKVFNVTSSTSATHTLSWNAPNEQSLFITINGVKQQDDAYSIAGTPTVVTLTDALVATDKMEVVGVLDIGQTTIVGDNTVSTAKLGNSSVTLAKLSTSGTAVAGNYLDGTMAWTAVDSVPDLITEGDVYKNYKTFATTITIPVDANSNQGLIGPIAFTGDVTITGDLTIW
jgi:hypothetical protein